MSKFLQGVRNLLLAALLLVAALCVAEVGIRAARWRQSSNPAFAGAIDNADIVVAGGETFYQLRQLALVEREVPETGEWVALRTNSLGLRGPEIELPKPTGVFRILCLGDETTLAPEVPEEQTYCLQLQQLLQPLTDLNVEVVNAGLPGGCPLTCELLLRRRLLGIQPDLILLHCDDSDPADDRLIRRFTRLDANGVPLAAVHPLSETGRASPLTGLYDEFAVLDLVRNRLVDVLDSGARPPSALTRTSLTRPVPVEFDGASGEVDVDQALAGLPRIRDLAAGTYCEFIVSRCPTSSGAEIAGSVAGGERRIQPASSVEDTHALGLRLVEVTQEHRITYVDTSAEFGPQEHQLFLGNSSALSAEGHLRYARALARIVYERVPGVWTRPPAPSGVPPLPGVARTPREIP